MTGIVAIDALHVHRALVESAARGLSLAVDWAAAEDFADARFESLQQAQAVLLDLSAASPAAKALLTRLTRSPGRMPVVAIVPTADAAIEASQAGVGEIVFVPLDGDDLRQALQIAVSARLTSQATFAVRETAEHTCESVGPLVGRSTAMRAVYKAIGIAASHNVGVLIVGESGTGKRAIARAIHRHSDLANAPLATIECTRDTQFGRNTQLSANGPGQRKRQPTSSHVVIPAAGTSVLCRVDLLGETAQRQLLQYVRELDEPTHAQEISSASAPRVMVTALADAAPDGSECWNCSELYYELGRLVIVAPPLHERLDDLGCLAEYFLRYWSRRLAKRVYRISPSAVELLRSRPWPGNLRQLSTIVCQAVAHAGGGMLQAADFPASSQVGNSTSLKEMSIDLRAFVDEQLAAGSTAVYRDALEAMEQRLLKQVLKRAAGNQAHAAKALGIARSRLRQKLRQHGIVIDRRAEVREMPTASVP